jgi:hypothetical protein
VSVREALDLIGELTFERSHYTAAVAGWSRAASMADLHLQLLAVAAAGAGSLSWPWQGTGTEAPATPEERAEAEALLQKYSAIRDN